MSSFHADLTTKIYPEPFIDYAINNNGNFDHFDRLPDSLLLLVFNKIGDIKALGRCCVVSRRFHALVPQVENVVVQVDCVISDDDSSSASSSSDKSRSPFVNLIRIVFGNIFRPLQALGQILTPKRSGSSTGIGPSASSLSVGNGGDDEEAEHGGVTHHSPTQLIIRKNQPQFTKMLITVISLIAASARHYLMQPIIAEHRTLDTLVLTDADGQGVLCMNREQLEELRVKPLSASSASKRTLVPALNMRLWYAPQLELPGGVLLKGATLVAIRPSEQSGVATKKEILDLSWQSFIELRLCPMKKNMHSSNDQEKGRKEFLETANAILVVA
ncbi:hypothetical protein Nepgr_029540 [Nepenthes gracilis]|uniref:F-box domain-containing protein n=1 Tax=Nepenthes gracilis TaxID=150966 RepID=A0AAD3TE58_NEPGR|nr:hypothetical protein Nepgr_029540 [Nepenthes gracilis]